MTSVDNTILNQEADRLYKLYAKPLEAKHKGEYIAVSKDGLKTILGNSLFDVLQKARKAFGPENYIFKVGTQSIGTWR